MQRQFGSVFLLAALLGLGFAAPAQSATPTGTSAKAAVPQEFTQGEVRKIDQQAHKVTLKHGEIKNLGMPPMAMVFEARDPSLLDKLKAGDKVRFKAIYDAGKYVVVDIQPDR
jgi:Cu/Ag efflux protein CusF